MSHHSRINFNESIVYTLLQIYKQCDDRPALAIGDETYSYYSLFTLAKHLASKLKFFKAERCLILSNRNISAYIGLLVTLLAGKAYVFLNTKDPFLQLHETILLAESDLLVSDNQHSVLINELNTLLSKKFTKITLDPYGHIVNQELNFNAKQFNQSNIYFTPDYVYPYAYMMVTYGSTGNPKW